MKNLLNKELRLAASPLSYIFLVAALITPPDVTSQVMVAVPILGLYELSIALSRIFYRKKIKKEEDTGEETEQS